MRLAGAYFCVVAVQLLAEDLEFGMGAWFFPSGMIGGPPSLFWTCWEFLKDILIVVIGVYLLFGGAWIVERAFPYRGLCCIRCGYNLRGSPGPQCPECGTFRPSETVDSVPTGHS